MAKNSKEQLLSHTKLRPIDIYICTYFFFSFLPRGVWLISSLWFCFLHSMVLVDFVFQNGLLNLHRNLKLPEARLFLQIKFFLLNLRAQETPVLKTKSTHMSYVSWIICLALLLNWVSPLPSPLILSVSGSILNGRKISLFLESLSV